MEFRELRIGNYIYQNPELNGENYCVVEEISEEKLLVSSRTLSGVFYDGFKPIPLTNEWLVRFGFEGNESERYCGWFSVDFRFGCWYFICNDGSVKPKLKYVHQLQNLYYALTGNELIAAKL